MEEEEIFKDVVGYEGLYEVSSMGRVRSLSRLKFNKNGSFMTKEIILKSTIKNGYHGLTLFANGTARSVDVHVLMAVAFLSHVSGGHKIVVDHINGIKADDRIQNLRIVTNRFNCSFGERINKNRLSSQYVGVSWEKARNKWRAYIKINGVMRHLGLFENEVDAADAYQKQLAKL